MKMTRTQICLPAPQVAWLQAEATRLGISVAELLRRLIDRAREAQ